jgi:hypothetical protein
MNTISEMYNPNGVNRYSGQLKAKFRPCANIGRITTIVRAYKAVADARNRPLLVIIDYLQRIVKPNSKNDVEGIAYIANTIKDIAGRFDCHIVLFSQLDFVHFNSGFVGCFISRSGFFECIVDSMMFEKSDSFPLAYFIEVESKCTKSSLARLCTLGNEE